MSYFSRVCEELISRDVKHVDFDNMEGNCPLHEACKVTDHEEDIKLKVVQTLSKTYIDNQNNEGCTPLHFAAAAGYEKIATFLISKNASIYKTDNDGWVGCLKKCVNKELIHNLFRPLCTMLALMATQA